MQARRPILIFALGAALCLGGALLAWRSVPRVPALPAAPPAAVPAFTLATQGGSFSERDLIGRWSLLFFGYTSCADACPTAMSLLREVKARLGAAGVAPPQVVLISVDPARDTPQLLGSYAAAFDAEFIGAVGSDAETAPLAGHLGVMIARHDQEHSSGYSVDHSAAIYLIDPGGRLRAVFGPPQDPARIAAEVASLSR